MEVIIEMGKIVFLALTIMFSIVNTSKIVFSKERVPAMSLVIQAGSAALFVWLMGCLN